MKYIIIAILLLIPILSTGCSRWNPAKEIFSDTSSVRVVKLGIVGEKTAPREVIVTQADYEIWEK